MLNENEIKEFEKVCSPQIMNDTICGECRVDFDKLKVYLSSQKEIWLREGEETKQVKLIKGITKWAEMAFKHDWINRGTVDGNNKIWEDSEELEASLQRYIINSNYEE